MPQVTFDADYWNGVKNQYGNWQFAWAREVGQNSLDAGATLITATVSLDNDAVRVIWKDNGCGMTEDILVNKFLALGGSFKSAGNTGGFGIAKSIVAFTHRSYVIHTGNLRLEGKGGEYEFVERNLTPMVGTEFIIHMEETTVEEICEEIRRWAAWSTTNCQIFLNEEKLPTLLLPTKPKQELPWAKVYVHRKNDEIWPYKLRVRINGQYMFSVWSDVKRHVTVDITGENSQEYLTSNRDGLNWRYSDRLTKIVAQIFQDPNKITNTDIDHVTVYMGSGGKICLNAPKPEPFTAAAKTTIRNRGDENIPTPVVGVSSPLTIEDVLILGSSTDEYDTVETLREGNDFVVVNSLNREVPDKWLPATLSSHATKLMRRWNEVLKFCAPFCNVSRNIRTGWIFSTTSEAEYRYEQDYGYMILLNPIKLEGNRLKQAYNGTANSFYQLVANAVHELTHDTHSSHGEAFASAITDNLAKVMTHYPQLELLRKQTA